MRNVDENFDKDAFNNIKTASVYQPKSTLIKISYANFCKLAQITKKFIILVKLCIPLILSNTSATQLFAFT